MLATLRRRGAAPRAVLAGTLLVSAVALAACGGDAQPAPPAAASEQSVPATTTPDTTDARADHAVDEPEDAGPPDPPATTVPATVVPPAPDWIGTRPLPLRPDGLGEVLPTPPELTDRRFATPELLPPPDGDGFVATVGEVPPDVVARSTWHPGCPVGLDDLRYLTVTFWGFDERAHTGELLVHASAVVGLVSVFERLHELRFPVEEMRVVRADELEAHPTGDGNVTSAFVCRSTVGGGRWSEHAFGLAVDVNPFHNPYVRGDVVVPELASAYLDRGHVRPGMILAGDEVVAAFAAIGWGWGGDFSSSSDPMHFSATGR